jgi:TonB family protein
MLSFALNHSALTHHVGTTFAPPKPLDEGAQEANRLVGALTLALWSVGVSLGVLGFFVHYPRPHRVAPQEEAVTGRQLQVELDSQPEPLPAAELALPDPTGLPPPPDEMPMPQVTQPIPVARPDPKIAFAVPVQAPTRVVEAARAAHSLPATNQPRSGSASVPSPTQLVFGEGEGKQPAPDYPRQAMRLGQEGTVVVQLNVEDSGRVLSAMAEIPSPWPLLNEAALRVVREKWRFPPGPARTYQVAIRFEILK